MYPDLLHDTGVGLVLPAYGVLIALGYLAALAVAGREAPRVGLDRKAVTDLMFYCLIAALVGSRLAFLVVNWQFFIDLCFDPASALPSLPCSPSGTCPDLQLCTPTDGGPMCVTQPTCTAALEVWRGGFVFYGGLILATALAILYTRRRRMSFPLVADTIIPGVSLGHAIGRIGCFFAGCCYGCRTDLPIGVRFPPGSEAWLLGGPVHPTQLYESAAEVVIFSLLLVLRSRKRFHGQVVLAYGLLYAPARFAIELLRGDAQRGMHLGLSTSQWTSIAIGVVCAGAWWVVKRRALPLAKTSASPAS